MTVSFLIFFKGKYPPVHITFINKMITNFDRFSNIKLKAEPKKHIVSNPVITIKESYL